MGVFTLGISTLGASALGAGVGAGGVWGVKSVRLLEKAVVGCAGGRSTGGVWVGGRLWLKAVEGVSTGFCGCGFGYGCGCGWVADGVGVELAKSMRRLLLLVSPAGWKKLVKSYPLEDGFRLEVSLGLAGELKSTTKFEFPSLFPCTLLSPAGLSLVVVAAGAAGVVGAGGVLVELETAGAGVGFAGLVAAGL